MSSRESELSLSVRGAATTVDMKNMIRDHGNEVKVALVTDSMSGCGMSPRQGAGKVTHVDNQWLREQGVFHRGEATIRKIPRASNEAGLMTKFFEGK